MMNNLMTRSMGPTYDGKTQQVFHSDMMSQSIIDFNTVNNAAHPSHYHFSSDKGSKQAGSKSSSSSSLSYATLPKKHHLQGGSQKSQSPFGSYGLQSSSSSQQHQKEFRTKPLIGWSTTDVCDWLDSLFMPEYKPAFLQNEIDGFKLASITKSELEILGVIRVGHMLNIEKSLKRYLTA